MFVLCMYTRRTEEDNKLLRHFNPATTYQKLERNSRFLCLSHLIAICYVNNILKVLFLTADNSRNVSLLSRSSSEFRVTARVVNFCILNKRKEI